MNFLSGLFGADDSDDEQGRMARANDFMARVQSGNKMEGYSVEEAVQNYASVSDRLSDEEFEDAAAEAFQQMSPEHRQEFATVMEQQGGVDAGIATNDPNQLAGVISQLRSQAGGTASGVPGGLFGGDSTNDMMGALSGLLSGGNLGPGGVATTNQAGIVGLLNNPIVKMVFGLIAANGMKRVMGDGQGQRDVGETPASGEIIMDALFGRTNESDETRAGDVDAPQVDRDERKRRL